MKHKKLNYITITKRLMNLSADDVERDANIFVFDSSIGTEQKFRKFAVCLQKAVIMKPNHSSVYVNYVKCIIRLLPEGVQQSFKNEILLSLIHDFESEEILRMYCSIAKFLHTAVEQKIFEVFEIANRVHDLTLQKPRHRRIFTELLFWFGPEFCQFSITFIKSLRRYAEIEKTARTLPLRYRALLRHMDAFILNKWSDYANFVKVDPLRTAIEGDSLKDFKLHLAKKTRMNDRLEAHPFEVHWMLLDRPTVAQCCAYFGASKCLHYLIRKKADLDPLDDRGRSISDFAIAGQNMEVMYALRLSQSAIMSSFVLLHSKDMMSGSDLEFQATAEQVIFSNNILILRRILNSATVNEDLLMFSLVNECPRAFLHMITSFPTLDLNKLPFLHVAVQTRQIDIMVRLLKNPNVDVNSVNERGLTPLQVAIESLDQKVIELMLSCSRVDVDVKWSDNRSILHEAILRGGLDAVKSILMCDRFDVNSLDANNHTPLHYATRNVNSTGTHILVEYRRGETISRDEKYIFSYQKMIHDAILIALLDCRRIRLAVFDNIGWSPVHHAARYGRYDFVRMFEILRDDHDTNVRTLNENQTVLHIAAVYGRTSLALILKNSTTLDRAAVDATNRDAVSLSVTGSETSVFKALLADKATELNTPDVSFNLTESFFFSYWVCFSFMVVQ